MRGQGVWLLEIAQKTCKESLSLLMYIKVNKQRVFMRSGVVTEEQGRQNIYAVEPKMYVSSESQLGFNKQSELLNGRLAMIGFVSLLILEGVTGHGLIGFLTSL